ncbi:MAG: inositol monophosphatase [Alphaproteobacteria bacterium]|nr:inositol monophosphatase [Alphaproteobacteria bacterium]
MTVYSPIINVIVKAVMKASKGLKRDFGEIEKLQVSKKGLADFVSVADLRADKVLREELKKMRPTFGFLTEELGEEKGQDPNARWIIDPLDGTTNFLHGLPHFAISVALEQNKEIVAAVIYDPIKDELFRAEKGQGAFLNDKRLRVSSRRNLDESLFATGIPFKGRNNNIDIFLQEIKNIIDVSAGIRRFGAASLDLAYVAAGKFEGFWESNLSSWDMAAGILMVKEAGGQVSDFDGTSLMLETGNIIAANREIFSQMLKLINKSKVS